jgi:hypothetical protein
MKRQSAAFLVCMTLCLADNATHAIAADWGRFSLLLSEGMTEKQVIEAIGSPPNMAELQTCGSDTASGEWTCRIITYKDRRSILEIFERRSDDDLWVVNSWRVH